MAPQLSTPKQALDLMQGAGATFIAHPRARGLETAFTFEVREDGDCERCREILREVRQKPRQFMVAFRLLVGEIAR